MHQPSALGERIRAVRRHYRETQEEFGEKIGISGNRVSELENGKGGTGAGVVQALCAAFSVRHQWVLSGKGEMLEKAEKSRDENDLSHRLLLLEERVGRIMGTATTDREETGEDEAVVQVPLYSSAVPAGMPAAAADEVECSVDFPRSWTKGKKNIYALTVSGDSMMDIGIMPGDTLLVEARETARDGQVVIASLNSEVTVKTLCISAGGAVALAPENRKYHPIPVPPDSDFRIMGVVLAAVRQYR
ncbi:helix-turn-helix domain-containing protein [Pelodictyon luteolum]|uniref:Transcriptional regulator, XRE family n=1 Tax=Chlorobium luteolum (strain DSM 273 / BCRC 81028 / 2530) TaxID=319225 RepID=Q3B450_CHLL3|nr:S24 family peptidase [Pelodictyon luteolum]ABB23881.1 transcriptional regulator, XRE family [Pelodictyon luteolum DSM 273]